MHILGNQIQSGKHNAHQMKNENINRREVRAKFVVLKYVFDNVLFLEGSELYVIRFPNLSLINIQIKNCALEAKLG